MLIRPRTLSLITTHQCTAACDHCCFHCTPKVTKAIPVDRLEALIDEAACIPSIRLVVFTGGECFLLGRSLDELIQRARGHGLLTRCVTNGYWGTSRAAAEHRALRLADAGLNEINFSTGMFHARYVPVERIVHGAKACVGQGLTTLINIETCEGTDFDANQILEEPDLKGLHKAGSLLMQRIVWIANEGESDICHDQAHSRFNDERISGCDTALNVVAVTPDLDLMACCGLHMEKIPDLRLGSVASQTIRDVLDAAPDDFLKIWIHVAGPERILLWAKQHLPDLALPLSSPHPCETCLHLYRDERALAVVRDHYDEMVADITQKYMASVAAHQLTARMSTQLRDSADGF